MSYPREPQIPDQAFMPPPAAVYPPQRPARTVNQPNRSGHLWIAAGAITLALLLGYLVVSPYITMYRMKSAAIKGDAETLSSMIDFPDVRESLKIQINDHFAAEMASEASTEGGAFSAMGSAFASALAEKMIDAYVTPEGITRLMSGESFGPNERDNARDPFSGSRAGYQSPNRFAVTVKNDDGEDVQFVLHRDWIGWKLSDIRMPK